MSVKRSLSKRLKSSIKRTKTKLFSADALGIFSATESNDQQEYNEMSTLIQSNSSTSINPIKRSFSQLRIKRTSEQSLDLPTPTPLFQRKTSGSIRRKHRSINSALPSLDSNIDYESDEESFKSFDDLNTSHTHVNEEVILLPMDPIDKSLPPCTTEQLTPIIPMNFELLQNKLDSSPRSILANESNLSNDKKPLILHSISTNTNSTMMSLAESGHSITTPGSIGNFNIFDSTSGFSTSYTKDSISGNIESSPVKVESNPEPQAQIITQNISNDNNPIFNSEVNPIFIKANQIDHLQSLDVEKTDRLADKMALNILQNISEENVDELSKLKDEIAIQL
ncbi:hypothetical protein DAMA08_009350 [Martiniozyma asiatica (nom. inval.)]|nr:hypothetical protein DAMA08_009350 [Martiniozyma asiatica]